MRYGHSRRWSGWLRWPLVGSDGSTATTFPIVCVGAIGGLTLGALASTPADVDVSAFARQVQEQLTAGGYDVAGLSMALAIKVAGVAVGGGESPLLAVARADHLTRGPSAAG